MTVHASSPRSTPPPTELTAGSWRWRAACRNHPTLPPSTWDDAPGPGRRELREGRGKRIERAQSVCWNECPVRQECLDDVDLDYDEGVRGGEDLRVLKAERRYARAEAVSA